MSNIDELEKLQKLREEGALTDEEFETAKKKILSNNTKEKVNVNSKFEEIKKKVKEKKNKKVKKCRKCGNEIKEGEKFCGNCGAEIKRFKIKKYQIVIAISVVVLLVIGSIIGGIYYNITVITNKDITQYFKDNFTGADNLANSNVEIIGTSNIQYNNYNKLVLANLSANDGNSQKTTTAIILANKKENDFKYIGTSMEALYLLNGVSNSNVSTNVPKVLEVTGDYITNKGIDFFEYANSEDYKNWFNAITRIDGIDKSRQYIKTRLARNINNSDLEYTVLFEKNTAIIKYIAVYEQTLESNSKWPINESTYKYHSKRSIDDDTLDFFTRQYGPAYVPTKKYNVYSMETEDMEKVGTYDTLEEAENDLDVEE